MTRGVCGANNHGVLAGQGRGGGDSTTSDVASWEDGATQMSFFFYPPPRSGVVAGSDGPTGYAGGGSLPPMTPPPSLTFFPPLTAGGYGHARLGAPLAVLGGGVCQHGVWRRRQRRPASEPRGPFAMCRTRDVGCRVRARARVSAPLASMFFCLFSFGAAGARRRFPVLAVARNLQHEGGGVGWGTNGGGEGGGGGGGGEEP